MSPRTCARRRGCCTRARARRAHPSAAAISMLRARSSRPVPVTRVDLPSSRARRAPRSRLPASRAPPPGQAHVRRPRSSVRSRPQDRHALPGARGPDALDLTGRRIGQQLRRAGVHALRPCARIPCIQKLPARSISVSAALALSPAASRASRASARRSTSAASGDLATGLARRKRSSGPLGIVLRPEPERGVVEPHGGRRPRTARPPDRPRRAAPAGPTRPARACRHRRPPPARAPAGSGARASPPGPRDGRATRSRRPRVVLLASAPHAGSGRTRRRGSARGGTRTRSRCDRRARERAGRTPCARARAAAPRPRQRVTPSTASTAPSQKTLPTTAASWSSRFSSSESASSRAAMIPCTVSGSSSTSPRSSRMRAYCSA